MPLSGSTVCTIGSVMKGPPSQPHDVSAGRRPRSTSSPSMTVCWHSPRDDSFLGNHLDMSCSSGSMRSLSIRVFLGDMASCSSESIRRVRLSSESTPSAIDIRRSEPIMFVSTGNSVPVFSNSRARPPPSLLDMRSVISAISHRRSTRAATRTSSPAASKRDMY
jgi:hypothetical protein